MPKNSINSITAPAKRIIVLDLETTGLDPEKKHKIIEVCALELDANLNAVKRFHHYLNPKRKSTAKAFSIHQISDDFLQDKPLFKDIAVALAKFLYNSKLVIHNADFDLKFLKHEFKTADYSKFANMLDTHCVVFDTLHFARQMYPNSRNNLSQLAERLGINPMLYRKHGQHSAINDCLLLAKVTYMLTQYNPQNFNLEDRRKFQQFKLYQKTENFKLRFRDFTELQDEYLYELSFYDELKKNKYEPQTLELPPIKSKKTLADKFKSFMFWIGVLFSVYFVFAIIFFNIK